MNRLPRSFDMDGHTVIVGIARKSETNPIEKDWRLGFKLITTDGRQYAMFSDLTDEDYAAILENNPEEFIDAVRTTFRRGLHAANKYRKTEQAE